MPTTKRLPMESVVPAPSPRLEARTRSFIDSLTNAPPLHTLPPNDARAALASLQARTPVRLLDVSSQDRTLAVGPDGRTNVRVVRPAGVKSTLPVVVYIHGGGWVLGDASTHDRLVRELVVGANVVIVFIDYDRSPESRFPVAIEQSYAVLNYVAEFADEFGGDRDRIAIAGDSVGGNMTTVVAMMAKERSGPALAAQLMFYPVTDASMSSRSFSEFADGPGLTRKAMAWFWDQYMPDPAARHVIHASPLNASIEQLHGLPPALLLVGENDVLRDEGEAYAHRLAQAGVDVTSVRYNGTIHDFMMLNPVAETPATLAAVAEACHYLRTMFAGN